MLTPRERAGIEPAPLSELAADAAASTVDRLRDAYGNAYLLLDADFVTPCEQFDGLPTAVAEVSTVQRSTRLPRLRIFAIRKSTRNFEPVITLGRLPSCDLVIAHPSVSACHALFIATEQCVALYDAGSTNGTTINGDPVPLRSDARPLPLAPLSRIRFGSVETTYLDAERLLALIEFSRQHPDGEHTT
ncbi:MAG: FHA domain-containing protein [Deltaproteobacteria bacterium]|nr:FHA domain-containing protein [Deltaproteobacteria bacterium]